MGIFISKDGRQFGPYSEEQVRKYLATGFLRSGDLACREGCSDWSPVQRLLSPVEPVAVGRNGKIALVASAAILVVLAVTAGIFALEKERAASSESVEANPPQAETPHEAEANARSFVLDGVRLGMPESEFLRLFPDARPFDELTAHEAETIALRVDETQNTDGIDAAFYEGKLLEFYVWYFPRRVNAMGGDRAILGRLVEKFGKAGPTSNYDSDTDARLVWRLEEANFFLQMIIKKDKTVINVTDMLAHTRRSNSMRDSPNPGF
jgi:hypothetical protein